MIQASGLSLMGFGKKKKTATHELLPGGQEGVSKVVDQELLLGSTNSIVRCKLGVEVGYKLQLKQRLGQLLKHDEDNDVRHGRHERGSWATYNKNPFVRLGDRRIPSCAVRQGRHLASRVDVGRVPSD